MFFAKDTITFVGAKPETDRLVQPVLSFIAYSTFIHYNVWWPTSKIPSSAEYSVMDPVPFSLERIIRVERESVIDGKAVRTMHFEGRRENRELTVSAVSTFLTILNKPLYASLVFYLRGCANPMYFLMDYYKAVESVVRAYGTQKLFFEKLRPYGITRGRHSDFAKVANADPVDIGRHAPEFGAAIHSFDIKTMMYDPRWREIFENSTTYCRDVIAGYIAALSVPNGGASNNMDAAASF